MPWTLFVPSLPLPPCLFIAKKVTLWLWSLADSSSCWLTGGIEGHEGVTTGDGDDTGLCGFAFPSMSGHLCALSPVCKAKGESSVGIWLDLDFPWSERSRGPSNASLSSPETLSVFNGGMSFFSWGLVWRATSLTSCSDINLNTTVGSLAGGWWVLCLCQGDPETWLLELVCWLVGIRLGKRSRFGLEEGCATRLVAEAAGLTKSEDSEKGQLTVAGLLLVGWGRQGTGAWSTCLLGVTSPPVEKEKFLRRAWWVIEDRWSSSSTLWALSYVKQKRGR